MEDPLSLELVVSKDEEELRARIGNENFMYLMCPKHGTPMHVIRARKVEGEQDLVTFQCWESDPSQSNHVCGIILQAMESPYIYHPKSLEGACMSPVLIAGDSTIEDSLVDHSTGEKGTVEVDEFPNPWKSNRTRSGVHHLVWQMFFDSIHVKGYCDAEDLSTRVYEARKTLFGEDLAKKDVETIRVDIERLPRRINWRTGYIIKREKNTFRVVGRGAGREGWFQTLEDGTWVPWGLEPKYD